jgi:polyisoprenoid-binding protein YceI
MTRLLTGVFISIVGLSVGALVFTHDLWGSGLVPRTFSEAIVRYEIDPARSKFMVKASRGGLFWFKGHDHHIAVKEFSGHADLTLDPLDPAKLEMDIRAGSLEETSDVFTPQQKAIINKELDEIVLESEKYPEIKFRSRKVSGAIEHGQFEAVVSGDITLHGVTRHVEIPTQVTLDGDMLKATGHFALDRSDFDVKATSAFHGLVRVKNKLKFTFEIIATRSSVSSTIENEG